MRLETVKVVTDNEQGFKIINKDDFDGNEHELFDKPKRGPKPQKKD